MDNQNYFQFKPELTKQLNFDDFWDMTLKALKARSLNLRSKKLDYPTKFCDVYEIIFNGYDDTDIYGYLMKPNFTKGKVPVVIYYHGFGGNGGIPADFMHYVNMGIAVLTFDIRGQSGKTGNHQKTNYGSLNVMCNGILDEHDYYYRAVYCDCIKALDIVSKFDCLDETKMIIDGVSQGGGIAMAVSSLDSRPKLVLANIPSYSYFQGRFDTATGSVSHIVNFVKNNPSQYERVMKTLSYFDTMNMADKITCEVLASVGLKDNVCPAKFYFATYNRILSPKEIKIYPLGTHEAKSHLEYKMNYILENIDI